MNPTLKNILALLAGIVVGWIVNMSLVMLGPMIIATPEGCDMSTMESMMETFHLLEPRHMIFPFIAHAAGTLAGAFVITKIAASRSMMFSLIIGAFFFIGGSMMVYQLPSPMWFNILDLTLAYIPMAWLGNKLAGGGK